MDDGGSAPSTPGKLKTEKHHHRLFPLRWYSLPRFLFCSLIPFTILALSIYCISHDAHSHPTSSPAADVVPSRAAEPRRALSISPAWGGPQWEKRVLRSADVRLATKRGRRGISVLVTGAAGFVGSQVALALKLRGDGVVGLDNFNDFYNVSLKRDREGVLRKAGVFIVDGDINDAALLQKLFKLVHFTHVMHLAAQAGVRYAKKNPNAYIHSNVAGLVSVLEAAKSATPQPAIVWASSSSVYGLNSKTPFSESDRTDLPASLYAATKRAGEGIAHTYNHIHGLSITALRFFTVYGPWGRPDMIYFFFTRDIISGKEITVYEGPGHSKVARDFTYIDDTVKGCIAALDTAQKSTGNGTAGEKNGPAQFRVYNLGNKSPVPILEIVDIIERILKVKANRKMVPMPLNGDVQFTHANISLAQRELGYQPRTDIRTGLKKFVKWYLGYYKSSSRSSGKTAVAKS